MGHDWCPHGSHHPTMNGIWSISWLLFQVMSNIPKMGQANQPLLFRHRILEETHLSASKKPIPDIDCCMMCPAMGPMGPMGPGPIAPIAPIAPMAPGGGAKLGRVSLGANNICLEAEFNQSWCVYIYICITKQNMLIYVIINYNDIQYADSIVIYIIYVYNKTKHVNMYCIYYIVIYNMFTVCMYVCTHACICMSVRPSVCLSVCTYVRT